MFRYAAVWGGFLSTVLASPAAALEVKEVRWGFDGQVVSGLFNPLSVRLHNPRSEAYNGLAVLYLDIGVGQRVGAQFVEPVYLAPGTDRWVQFYPFIGQQHGTWRMKWGLGLGPSLELSKPRVGQRARVLLVSDDFGHSPTAGLRRFPSSLFPPTVTATDGLAEIVLDHVPDLAQPRRQALIEWLQRGGIVHLLLDVAGSFPEFEDELALLNVPTERQRIGAGTVVRHRRRRQEVSAADFDSDGAAADDPIPPTAINEVDTLLASVLRGLVRPKHNWSLIYVLSAAYLLLIGPVNFLVGRKYRDYRISIGFLLGIIALFGCSFLVIGRRGYDETSKIHTLSYVRPISNTKLDLTQWTNVFVNRGDYYTLTHAGTHNLYSSIFAYEAVNAVIDNGAKGQFQVDMPPYSNCEFVHRGTFVTLPLINHLEWGQDDLDPHALAVVIGAGFPGSVHKILALYRDQFYRCRLDNGRVRLGESAGDRQSFLRLKHDQQVHVPINSSAHTNDIGQAFQRHLNLVMARGIEHYGPRVAPELVMQLFVLADSPRSLSLVGEGLGQEEGLVLYHIDLTLAEP